MVFRGGNGGVSLHSPTLYITPEQSVVSIYYPILPFLRNSVLDNHSGY